MKFVSTPAMLLQSLQYYHYCYCINVQSKFCSPEFCHVSVSVSSWSSTSQRVDDYLQFLSNSFKAQFVCMYIMLFLPQDAYAVQYMLWPGVWSPVNHMLALHQNSLIVLHWFSAQMLPLAYPTLCCKVQRSSAKMLANSFL